MDGIKYWAYLQHINKSNNEKLLNKKEKLEIEEKNFFWKIEKFEK